MKNVLISLCVIAILINISVSFYFEEASEVWTGSQGEEDEKFNYSEFSVTVPEIMQGDIAQYDYSIFIEMYWENKTSGDWERYTLTANGYLIDKISSILEKKDGFNMGHDTYGYREETYATLTIAIDSSEGDDIEIHGTLDGTRTEFIDINERKVIQILTEGNVSVDQIRQMPIPISYEGKMRNYPNPNLERKKSLDEKIFLGDKMLKFGDEGSVTEVPENIDVAEWLTQVYNWSVIGGEKVAGYNALIINITTGFFQGWMPFTKQIWIANEVPFPVKVFLRTNTSAEDKNGSFYTIIEHRRTLQDNGFTRGGKVIPWDTCSAGMHFLTRHPRGVYESLDYIPNSGPKYDQSSFDYKPEDAVNFALENSKGLKRLITRFDDVAVSWGVYKAEKDVTDIQGKAGSYNWNLSFGYKPTREEQIEAWESGEDPHWGYYVNLTRNLTKEPGFDRYSEEIKIINEGEYRYGDAELSKERDLSRQALTLASSEIILKLDPDVSDQALNTVDNEINFRDTTYSIAMGDISSSGMPGLEIVQSITGITMPTFKYAWVLHKGSVYRSGNTFSAAVDAETGQFLYTVEISGNELLSIFG
jgi:hypothetical protein